MTKYKHAIYTRTIMSELHWCFIIEGGNKSSKKRTKTCYQIFKNDIMPTKEKWEKKKRLMDGPQGNGWLISLYRSKGTVLHDRKNKYPSNNLDIDLIEQKNTKDELPTTIMLQLGMIQKFSFIYHLYYISINI